MTAMSKNTRPSPSAESVNSTERPKSRTTSSGSKRPGSNPAVTAPSLSTAMSSSTHSKLLRAMMPTRSRRPIPSSRNRSATAVARASTSAIVDDLSPPSRG